MGTHARGDKGMRPDVHRTGGTLSSDGIEREMDSGTSSEMIDTLARELFHRADSTGLWSCADYIILAHFRREAQRQLQQSYTKLP